MLTTDPIMIKRKFEDSGSSTNPLSLPHLFSYDRQSLLILQNAIQKFSSTDFNLMLGDILDGKAKTLGMNFTCLDTIHELCRQSPQPWYCTLGNHEYYNFTRHEIFEKVYFSYIKDLCPTNKLYYSFQPKVGYRCLVLDGYEVSTIGPITPEFGQQAEETLVQRNPNYAAGSYSFGLSVSALFSPFSIGSTDWLLNLSDENLRYLPFNGGISSQQLKWLESELFEAVQHNERCLIFSHMAIYRPASQEQNLLWNAEAILHLLHTAPHGTVIAVISGHDHDGGYACDDHGIHHIVPCSPIECEEGEMSYGLIEIYSQEKMMRIDWTGKVPPRLWGETLDLF
jgi:manganese-dependent ADP-ribose/CDP-alcohol diphosphatase